MFYNTHCLNFAGQQQNIWPAFLSRNNGFLMLYTQGTGAWLNGWKSIYTVIIYLYKRSILQHQFTFMQQLIVSRGQACTGLRVWNIVLRVIESIELGKMHDGKGCSYVCEYHWFSMIRIIWKSNKLDITLERTVSGTLLFTSHRTCHWSCYINILVRKACRHLYHLKCLRDFKPPCKVLRTFYTFITKSIFWEASHPGFGAAPSRIREFSRVRLCM